MSEVPPLTIGKFKGTYDRGEEESVPIGYFRSSQNIEFVDNGVQMRDGSDLTYSLNINLAVRRQAIYEKIGEAKRTLILNGVGQLYDSTEMSAPILTIAAMSDFSMVTMFDRAYITPHNGVTGLPGEKVYVYNGSGTARAAGGLPPGSFVLGVASTVNSGHMDATNKVFAVAYLTDTGFITKPAGYVAFTPTADLKISFSAIPIGGAGVVGRVILATKGITDFDGNFEDQTYYFMPGGTINDNVSTTLSNIEFFDADLIDDASRLVEQLSEIPAGVCIDNIGGRLCVGGEDANASVVRVSQPGEPESHNAVDGFITVNPGDVGGGVKNLGEHRTMMIITKSLRTYGVQPNNDVPPSEWIPIDIDGSIGAGPHAIGRSLSHGENIEDRMWIAAQDGLRLFDGTFSPANVLSYNIQAIWDNIAKGSFHKVEVAVDPLEARVYIAVPEGAATNPTCLLVCDYNEGATIEGVRWTIWRFANINPVTITVITESGRTLLMYGGQFGNVYTTNTGVFNDNAGAIITWVEMPHLPSGDDEDILYNFLGCRFRARGTATLEISGKGIDDVDSFVGESIQLSVAPGRSYHSGFNYVGERAAIKLISQSNDTFFLLTKLSLYLAPIWADRPKV